MEKYQTIIIRLVIIIGVLLGIFLLFAIFSQAKSFKYIGSGLPAANTITVQGHGEVDKAPDTAKFSFTIQDEHANVADAQGHVSEMIDTVKKDLLAAGIPEQDITTDTYNSYPDYQYGTNNARTLKGYIVSQNVKVSVKDLTKTETVAGILGKDQVTNIDGPNLGFEDSHEITNEARDKAIVDAKVQAEKLAQSLGVHLVRIVSFNDNSSNGGIIAPVAYGMKSQAADVAASAPSIPTGVQTVSADVTVTYEIR